jgi:hypothetical protein
MTNHVNAVNSLETMLQHVIGQQVLEEKELPALATMPPKPVKLKIANSVVLDLPKQEDSPSQEEAAIVVLENVKVNIKYFGK